MCMLKGMALAGVLAMAPLVQAFAEDDRAPTPEERTSIESALRADGFVSWGEIELDDGMWEIDDAVTPDGEEYDVKLDRHSYAVIERERD